jgi:hypothetical protein
MRQADNAPGCQSWLHSCNADQNIQYLPLPESINFLRRTEVTDVDEFVVSLVALSEVKIRAALLFLRDSSPQCHSEVRRLNVAQIRRTFVVQPSAKG